MFLHFFKHSFDSRTHILNKFSHTHTIPNLVDHSRRGDQSHFNFDASKSFKSSTYYTAPNESYVLNFLEKIISGSHGTHILA